ncbi:tripartite tricarboxylate transporter substrate binding protein [Rhodoplanes sp. TEM]|uniref:Tripartite tricarboxylate transporter substrate binding protein n=1 Tax=Rhodoplanes tepidamans TaxID=200616 RepID=A0ABT5J918_RHOTP|nr:MULTISPECIES: tripartite tricarboxylate transporter substrate binding protein [Rhodoplanes]MDC7786135.1 tripartite tricarboxylate transporter substrate binding protein [Rhodoplanes tepidamans]MDC7982802.1 tripartite tricarboxylate transporter substrate binding protein [Rhodoplanes sp. TEM]MDQ0357200.1 tripartite-type tricarboxylate transporter receptor subunit TctC [Rhodoplanes tepidamans]
MIDTTRRRLLIGGAAGLAAASFPAPAVHAQAAWPKERPIKIVVPFPAGAANDAMGRLAGQRLQDKLGATVVVENRPGGSAVIGTTAVLHSPPDGYTLLASAFNHIVLNMVVGGVTFDPQKDFEVVGRTAKAPLVMVMAPGRPEKSIAEVIAAAKAQPDKWTFAVAALGAPSHLAAIDFLARAGLTMTISPYRGTAPALTDVMGGHVQLLIDSSFALLPSARDGKVKALGIASLERSKLAPEIPTIAESGMPGFQWQSWYGIWAPKGTPLAIREQINAVMREAMADPEVQKRLESTLLEPVVETIDETKSYIARDVPRLAALLKSVNFQPQ